VPVTIIVVMVLTAWSLYPAARVQYRETREKARLEAELEGLQARNDDLREQVDRLKTPEGVEDVARSTLGMVKEGENAYVVMDPEDESVMDRPAEIADTGVVEDTFWHDLLDMVFGVE
jgi:cell division protein FtsL